MSRFPARNCDSPGLAHIDFPNEMWDRIIDHLYDDDAALGACSLVAKSWLPTSRLHLFTKDDLLPAIEKGSADVVAILLARPSIDINALDNGRSPLCLAASHGRSEIVKLLLSRDDVQVDLSGVLARTPLMWAVGLGHQKVVELLLERLDVSVNLKDARDNTPLIAAIEMGESVIVALLLARDDININLPGCQGETPLGRAAFCGVETTATLLLARDDIDVNLSDGEGNTPLSIAAMCGHTRIVALLLARNDTLVNSRNTKGGTPLILAAFNPPSVAELLLKHPQIEIDTQDNFGQAALLLASDIGAFAVVELLIYNGADVNIKDARGRTALSSARTDKIANLLRVATKS